jgi:hypothetical protein
LRPKNCENPSPAFCDVPSLIATPLLELVAEIDSAPLLKLALPAAPRAVFSVDRKVAGVNAVVVPPTVMVPASKSMATLCCTTPVELVIATVVWPVKPLTAVGRSSPVLRPLSVFGGG